MTSLERLERLEGREVRLTFNDGEVSEVRIVAVDTDDHMDLVFEMHGVITPGPTSDRPCNELYLIPIANIIAVEPVDEDVPSPRQAP
ncbi:MAG TPA: hypothetical protein VFS20_04610 [Longimicrobium sp.]|nr:hypothetical protein [Longimicrobium sp.]